MKKKLLKSFLLVVGLLVGTSAWADKNYSQVFKYTFEDAETYTAPWTISGGTASQLTINTDNYIKFVLSAKNTTQTQTLDFSTSVAGIDDYKFTFDYGYGPMGYSQKGTGWAETILTVYDTSAAELFHLTCDAGSGAQTISVVNSAGTTIGSFSSAGRYSNPGYANIFRFTITADSEDGTVLAIKNISTDAAVSLSNATLNASFKLAGKIVNTLQSSTGTNYSPIAVFNDIYFGKVATGEVVSEPVIGDPVYDAANRKVTITSGASSASNAVTTYYTIDGTDPSASNYEGSFTTASKEVTITSNSTLKAISISSTDVSSAVANRNIVVGKLTLATPTISATGFTNTTGKSVNNPTFNFACDNSALLGTPTATLSYTFTPDGGVESSATEASSYAPTGHGTLKVIASADGYDSSEKTLVVSSRYKISYTGRDYTTAITTDITGAANWGGEFGVTWTGWASSLKANLLKVTLTDDNRLCISNSNTINFVNGWGWVRNDKSYSYRSRYTKEGYFVGLKVNTSKGSNASALTYPTIYCASGTGLITDYLSINVDAGNLVQQLYFYEAATDVEIAIENAIADCKAYETSSTFATDIDAEDFASAAEVYAFHSAWQIAQAQANSSTDYSKAIMNRTFELHNTNGWTIYGDAATNATEDNDKYGVVEYGDNYSQYYTGWNGRNVSQNIASLPAGAYRLSATVYSNGATVKLFANGNLSDGIVVSDTENPTFDFVVAGNEESIKIGIGGVGQGEGDNTWGKWYYRVKNFTLTKISVSGTIPSSGYGSLASAYGLDFSSATVSSGTLTAYVVTSTATDKVKLTSVDELPANQGVILKGTPGATYNIPVKADAAYAGANLLSAAVTATDIAANTAYILKSGEFHLVTADSKVPAGKAYLLASNVPSGARAMKFVFDDDATAVFDLNDKSEMINDNYYDLQGRRVSQPTKGLYIKNGRKVVVK